MDKYFTTSKVAKYLGKKVHHCAGCRVFFNFDRANIRGYEAAASWEVDDISYWLYIECDKCEYQTSFEKLGIPKSVESHNANPTKAFVNPKDNFYRTRTNDQIVLLQYYRRRDKKRLIKTLNEVNHKLMLVNDEIERREEDGTL